MLSMLIPSRDRACQLRILLESIGRNFPLDFLKGVHVYYDYSNPDFRDGYEKLRAELEGDRLIPSGKIVGWWREPSQKARLDEFLRRADGGYLSVTTDDSIFYRQFDLDPAAFDDIFALNHAISFSFRLGLNCDVVNQANGEKQRRVGGLSESADFIAWDWSDSTQHFAHPFALDGNVYRADDMRHVTRACEHDNFNAWECNTNGHYQVHGRKRWCAAFRQSCLVNVPNNRVSEESNSTFGTFHRHTLEELNTKYLGGAAIDLDAFDFSNVRSCQWEFPYTFRTIE